MKEKFRQTSFFSTFKRKLDIFKWQVKKSNREEPILLGIKSRRFVQSAEKSTDCSLCHGFHFKRFLYRNNCEVPCDDFEYFDSRNNNCERIKHIAEKSPVVTPVVDSLHRRYKNKGKNIVILPDHRHQIEDLQNRRLKYSSGSSCRPWWAARPSTRPVTPYWVRDLTAPEWLSMMARGPGLAESWPPASPSFSLITESSGLLLK